MTIFNIITLLGGLSLFLYGMRIMGDALKASSSGALKDVMKKVTDSPVKGFLLGFAVSAVIQSSTATIVITSGLVGAGVITLHQSLGIILGANVGTTVTGQIIRLLDVSSDSTSWLEFFKPSTLAPLAACAGILFIMALKTRNSDSVGTICMGFGILFTGLLNMTAAVDPLSESESFTNLFLTMSDNPLLGFAVGALVAFIIQSSSASVGILQALSVTGKLAFGSIYSVLVGIYVGDAVTTGIVCSLGAKPDAKRTGLVQVIVNACQVILIVAAVNILKMIGLLDGIWAAPMNSGAIANTHTLFKLACCVVLIPFTNLFEKLACFLVKDNGEKLVSAEKELEILDPTFYSAPQMALSAAHSVVTKLAELSCENVMIAMDTLIEYDQAKADKVKAVEDEIDTMADSVSDYLLKFVPYVGTKEISSRTNYYIRVISEFERIGDLALNLTENAADLYKKKEQFSDSAKDELRLTKDVLTEIIGYTTASIKKNGLEAAKHIEPVEEVVDALTDHLKKNHFERLNRHRCTVVIGFVYQDALVNIERISDQCSNIGVQTVLLFNPELNELEHSYTDQLHSGGSEQFNTEFKAAYNKYFGRLDEIEKSENDEIVTDPKTELPVSS